MTWIRQATTGIALGAASGGLVAAAMAGSPTARADNPFIDIVNDVQNSIAVGEADYSAAAADFSTAGDTNEGLILAFAGFDDIFVSPTYDTLLGLTAAATDTDFSGFSDYFLAPDASVITVTTAAGQENLASGYAALASTYFSLATSAFSGGDYFTAANDYLSGSFVDVLAGQYDILAGLFGLGI